MAHSTTEQIPQNAATRSMTAYATDSASTTITAPPSANAKKYADTPTTTAIMPSSNGLKPANLGGRFVVEKRPSAMRLFAFNIWSIALLLPVVEVVSQ